MKEPQDCSNLEEVRAAIDTIDREIIRLISKRGDYVTAAIPFKETVDAVKDRTRVGALLEDRKLIAREMNADPDLIEDIFKKIVDLFVKRELKQFKENHK